MVGRISEDTELNNIDISWKKRQISAFFRSRETQKKAPRRATRMKLALFVFFVATRALHPMLIDLSKHDGKILYAKNTPIVMNKVLTVLLMNVVAFLGGGLEQVRLCWQPRCLVVFGLIGIIYAMGDFLEMMSMSKLTGGVYQVLLQTKLLITALMCWWLKGSRQSSLQWHVLFAMFLATSCFVLADESASSRATSSSFSLPLVALLCVVLKVAVSCYCAVLSEKYLKVFADLPLPAKISGISTTWTLASLVFSFMEQEVLQHGFFSNWDSMTWLVTWSFVVKTVSTMYLLQALDAVQKNIGEALAVVVIYSGQVAIPAIGKAFDLTSFLLAVSVVALVKTYLISSAPKKKRNQSDTRLVSLNSPGSKLMQSLGIDSISCEVSEVLPPGVFYGMLGGVYPVCGSTDPKNPSRCDLVMLAHPPWSTQISDGAFGTTDDIASAMPTQSLTVLGQLRGDLTGENINAAQCMEDVKEARTKIAHSFMDDTNCA